MTTKFINATGGKYLMADHPEVFHNLKELYPKLEEFFWSFRGYDDYQIVDEMLEDYYKIGYGVNTEHIKSVVEEFDKLIKEDWEEVYLNSIIVGLGANINIDNDEWKPTSHTYKEWIVDLRNILQKEYDRRIAEQK